MATVNDNSVKWSLESIYNAGQLNGLTAEQIKSNAISGKVVLLSVGTVMLPCNKNTYTIPLPSGYSRSQCKVLYTPISTSRSPNYCGECFRYCTIDQNTGRLIGFLAFGDGDLRQQSTIRSEYFSNYAYIIIAVK